MTQYRVVFEVVVDGPDWPEGVQVPKHLWDWPQDIINAVTDEAAQYVVHPRFEAADIEVISDDNDE